MNQSYKQFGMSIIELMIALTIFMIITAALFSLYINANTSYNQDERTARLQENGRFALNTIAEDFTQIDFWGEMISPDTIVNTTLANDVSGCNAELENPSTALLYFNSAAVTPMFDPTGCAVLDHPDTGANVKANTNALVVKRVKTTPTPNADLVTNAIYLRSNGFAGELLDADASGPPAAGYSDWEYIPHMYFIRDDVGIDGALGTADDVPYLCQAEIALSTNAGFQNVAADCLAEGVQQLHVEFGLDEDEDGTVDKYISETDAAGIENAIAARIYLLTRSARSDNEYTNDKTYNLGSLVEGPFNDNYYRRVYSTTVALRNPRAYILLNQ